MGHSYLLGSLYVLLYLTLLMLYIKMRKMRGNSVSSLQTRWDACGMVSHMVHEAPACVLSRLTMPLRSTGLLNAASMAATVAPTLPALQLGADTITLDQARVIVRNRAGITSHIKERQNKLLKRGATQLVGYGILVLGTECVWLPLHGCKENHSFYPRNRVGGVQIGTGERRRG